jgi:2,3-bisphosphoglycerate-dependent phosphoglycerate mutase
MSTLILLRHGQSQWNLAHRFTGWVDVDLTEKGEAEARRAGERLAAEGVELDVVFTSVLTRAIRTAFLAQSAAAQIWVPVIKDWRLNERHYGGLTGLEHTAMRDKFGEEQVKIWRRSYDVPPPPLAPGGDYDFASDRRYAGVDLPLAESLKTTLERVLPYWDAAIAPRLATGDTVMVAAHGNSLRAIAKHLFAVSDADITALEIPTGNPLLVTLDEALKPTAARYLEPGSAAPLPAL